LTFFCGCKTQQGTADASSDADRYRVPSDFKLRMERKPCHGTCPVYTLTLDAEGQVTFQGQRNTELKGTHSKTLPAKQVRLVQELIQTANIHQFKNAYDDSTVADLPTRILAYQAEGRKKKVVARAGVPPDFNQLFRKLEEVIDLERGYGAQPQAMPGGTEGGPSGRDSLGRPAPKDAPAAPQPKE
jgi:hypothetical protein